MKQQYHPRQQQQQQQPVIQQLRSTMLFLSTNIISTLLLYIVLVQIIIKTTSEYNCFCGVTVTVVNAFSVPSSNMLYNNNNINNNSNNNGYGSLFRTTTRLSVPVVATTTTSSTKSVSLVKSVLLPTSSLSKTIFPTPYVSSTSLSLSLKSQVDPDRMMILPKKIKWNKLMFIQSWFSQLRIRSLFNQMIRIQYNMKRSMKLYAVTCFFVVSMMIFHPLPSFASTTPSIKSNVPFLERILEKTSPNVDNIIHQYVEKHMFQDDVYDPFEATYREVYSDSVTGLYPTKINEIAQTILKDDPLSSSLGSSSSVSSSTTTTPLTVGTIPNRIRSWIQSIDIGTMLTQSIRTLQNRLGVSESIAIMITASIFVVAGPSLFLFSGMIVGGISKRNMNQLMKKRYGDTYTVDATRKPEEPEVVAPPDDDEEDDDDDDDEDDDDDDDDDNDNKGKLSNKK